MVTKKQYEERIKRRRIAKGKKLDKATKKLDDAMTEEKVATKKRQKAEKDWSKAYHEI